MWYINTLEYYSTLRKGMYDMYKNMDESGGYYVK